jgi:hypothetical protein
MFKFIVLPALIIFGFIVVFMFIPDAMSPQTQKEMAERIAYETKQDAREATEQAKQDAEDAQQQAAQDKADEGAGDDSDNAESDTVPYHYNLQTSIMTAVLKRMEMATRECLNEAAILKLHQGERSRKAIVAYSSKLCGQDMAHAMQAPGLPPGAGEAYVESLAYQELDNALHSGQ